MSAMDELWAAVCIKEKNGGYLDGLLPLFALMQQAIAWVGMLFV